MFKFKITAKSVASAIQKGLEMAGLDKKDVEIKILRQAKNFKDAEIEILVADEIAKQNPQLLQMQIQNAENALSTAHMQQTQILNSTLEELDAKTHAQKFVEGVFTNAKCHNFQCDCEEDETSIHLNFHGASLQKFVGQNGRVLASVQTLANAVLKNQKRVVLDINNFKANKAKKVETLAQKIAKQVLESGQPVELKPMNAFERRLVHNVVANFENLATESRGEEPNRFVVISIKQPNTQPE